MSDSVNELNKLQATLPTATSSMPLKPLREMMKELVQLQILTEDQVRECTRLLPRDDNMIIAALQALEDKQYLTPYQVERIKYLDYPSLVLGGNKLLYENAAGSFARVFRAAKVDTNQSVAIKILRNRWAEDSDTVTLFKREAEVGKKLKHPNIVPVYDIGFDNDQHYFTMEFVEGGNLKDFIKIRGKLKPEEALKYVIDIAKGLEYAISLGFTHRDLKANNVLMTTNGVAKLIDFGLAATEEIMKKIGGEAFVNAIEYNTLEVGTNSPRNDPRSDLFFLGVIFYELISGKPPYEPTSDRQERKRLSRYSNIKPLINIAPWCPKTLAFIVDRLLKVNPEHRYQSATELIRDLKTTQGMIGESHVLTSANNSLKKENPLPDILEISESLISDTQRVKSKPHPLAEKSGTIKTTSKAKEPDLNKESTDILPPENAEYMEIKTHDHEKGRERESKKKLKILFLESRPKEQHILKEYFAKHGYRVAFQSDVSNMLSFMRNSYPHAVVIMGEILTNKLWKYLPVIEKTSSETRCYLLVIAGKNQINEEYSPDDSELVTVMHQPVTLRDMRRELQKQMLISGILKSQEEPAPAQESISDEIDIGFADEE